ncbi:MAG: VCBS repeat-containing protein [Myxococcales bacterium]|nr:VCBS repeat-containing protein [Myxococcales bacterium]
MLDYNGDGFTDLVDAVNKRIYVNKGNSKWEDASETLQSFPVTGADPNMRFFDYNGDKAIDVISSDGNTTNYWVSDGKGNWKVVPGQTNIGLGFANDRLRLIDINGDGLQDIVHITKNSMRYRKYLGYGEWTDWIDVTVPGLDKYELNINAQFSDINGDGMADMVAFLGNKIVYFVNKNGTEFLAGQELQAFKGVDIPDSTKATVRIADINGNGSRDIVWIDSSGKLTYLELFSKRPNLMTEISNGIGQRINVEYGSSVNFFLRDASCDKTKDAACAGPWQNKMPMAFTVVTKISTWASRSDKPADQTAPTDEERPMIQAIYYHDGFYDGVEKKFRGFRKVESIQVGDDSIEDLHQAITFDVGDKDPYFHGKMLHNISSNNKGHIYNETTMTWKECDLAGIPKSLDPPVRFICQSSQEQTIKEGSSDTATWKTLASEMVYDGFGNVTESTKLGVKDAQGDEQVVKRTYITPSDPNATESLWNIRLVQKVEFCNKVDPNCAETRYYYDGEAFKGLALGELRKGNLSRTETRKVAGQDQFIDIIRQKFDSYGNIIEFKTPRGLLRVVEWDDVYHLFAVKETVHVNENVQLAATVKWDYALSAVTQSTDYNGYTTSYTYDSFGRITSKSQPGDADGKPTTFYTYELQAPLSRIITQERTKSGADYDMKSVQCFDGMGRKIAVLHERQAGVYSGTEHTNFNSRGLQYRNIYPYQSDGKCSFDPPSNAKQTLTYFDGMGRVVKRVHPDGNFTKAIFEPLKITRFDEEDHKSDSAHYNTPKISLMDGLGRVLEMRLMPKAGSTITTKFVYTNIHRTGNNLIQKVIFEGGKEKVHTFDLLGRVIKLTDPRPFNHRVHFLTMKTT